jgi:GNAT superfamily N-acetyltransferase
MHIHRLDPANRRDVRRYIEFPFRLYRKSALWVPPFVNDIRAQLDPRRHPFYQHSEAAFFLALEGDEVVGRIAVLDNARHNEYHGKRTAFFYHFDAVNDRDISRALLDAAFDWARGRGLDLMWGPQGFLATDGKGLLVEGFEHRPAMGIPYNYSYYGELLEDAGFEKQLDFISCYVDRQMTVLPSRFLEVAEKVKRRRGFRSVRFQTKAELRAMIPHVMAVYNASFVEVQGYVPVTGLEAKTIGERILSMADPTLIAFLMKGDELAGFVLAYPDISAAVQRCRGRMWPTGWYHLLREFKRTRWLNFNGVAIAEPYRGLGGNALLYAELYHTLLGRTQYQYADLVQVQETNMRMIQELEAVEVRPYKKHRIYQRSLA